MTPDKGSGQKFVSGERPEKLISRPFAHPLLMTAVTPSKEISCSGIAVERKEKRQREVKIKKIDAVASGMAGIRRLLRDATQKHLLAAAG